jgi:hypothetical protein
MGKTISKKELAEKFRKMADQIDGYMAGKDQQTPGAV